MGAYPDPDHLLARLSAERAIVISEPNAEAIFAPLQPSEAERGVTRVRAPQTIVLTSEILNFSWQF